MYLTVFKFRVVDSRLIITQTNVMLVQEKIFKLMLIVKINYEDKWQNFEIKTEKMVQNETVHTPQPK